ncbi:TIGR02530 family flagellar biosynthesis protein [Kurthia sibirica]|uniref:Flagellar protein n=1 Tax=Kurthia sibirica TaxID=202750 RepID=A0A2U3AQT5_9BACL|nr:TIGR02530 family flagellar biosynthesis protein [Kurthia sibirica]PWI26901.1 hypothetical protein DEX24_00965 [Kurthia sibirica]GEK32558.1 hypothetical protein KSI01_00910 [Kurthia sibirica]
MKPIRLNQPMPIPQQQFKNKSVKQLPQNSFARILHTANQDIKVSKHAQQRIEQRKIDISATEWHAIEEKIVSAHKKGLNDALVLTKNAALIINVKNQTVITAMNRQEANDQIFTNIDGAIVL